MATLGVTTLARERLLTPSRRRFIRGIGAVGLAVAAPSIVRAQSILLPNPRRGVYFPPGGALNRSHPLAFGLCFLAVPAVAWNYDLVSGVAAASLATTATAPQVRGTVAGQAVFFGNGSGSTDIVVWPGSFAPILTSDHGVAGGGDFSIAVVANPAAAAQLNFLFAQSNGGAVETYLCANQTAGGSTTAGAFNFLCEGTSGFTDVGVSSGATDGKPHVFMGTRSGTTHTLYIDGKQAAQTTGTARGILQAGCRIGYGNLSTASGSGDGANCGIIATAAWNRALSAIEALDFGTNPSGLLTYIDDDIFATIVGRAAGGGHPRSFGTILQ